MIRATCGHCGHEIQCLDRLEVLVADRVAATGDEVAVLGELVTGEHFDEAIGRLLLGEIQLELVELLVVPHRGAFGTVDLEAHLTLRTEDGAVGFQRAPDPVLELDESSDVVLVGDLAGRVARLAPVVVGAFARCRQGRSLTKISLVATTRLIGPLM